MTPIEVKIQYRFDTGLAPTYGYDKTGRNYKGALTHEYAEWLEEYRGPNPKPMSMTWQRDFYLKETGMHATYYDKDRNLRYTREYKLWMEQLLIKALSAFGKNIWSWV